MIPITGWSRNAWRELPGDAGQSLVSGVLGTSELKLSVAVTVRTCEAKSGISRQLVLHVPRASVSGRSYFQWAVCGGGGFGCLMHCRFSLPAGRG
ncbi:hypothetical protein AOLI_G00144790 [Acnodon oligacanthus]